LTDSAVGGTLVAAARFAPVLESLGEVRAGTVATLRRWSVEPDAVEAAELIVTELVSNAVKAAPRAVFVAVRLRASNGVVAVEVWDRDETTEPRVLHVDDDAETGRGLRLVEAMSGRWSWYRARSGGKVVWAEFPVAVVQRPAAAEKPVPVVTRRLVPVTMFPAPRRGRVEFMTDPVVLRRVADRLRALDGWEQSRLEMGFAVAPRVEEPR